MVFEKVFCRDYELRSGPPPTKEYLHQVGFEGLNGIDFEDDFDINHCERTSRDKPTNYTVMIEVPIAAQSKGEYKLELNQRTIKERPELSYQPFIWCR